MGMLKLLVVYFLLTMNAFEVRAVEAEFIPTEKLFESPVKPKYVILDSVKDIIASSTSENTLIIDMPIMPSTMSPVVNWLQWKIIAKTLPKAVTIIINSPGGSVATGNSFINLMLVAKAQGTVFTCIVPEIAASMAFHIFTHCDRRIALDSANLLWHRARAVLGDTPVTAPMAENIAKELYDIDSLIMKALLNTLSQDLSPKVIAWHLEVETFHSGNGLAQRAPHFMTSSPTIPGLFELWGNDKITRTQKPIRSLLDLLKSKSIQYIYIHESNFEQYFEINTQTFFE